MANVTAAVTVPTTALSGQPFTVTLVVANAGSGAVTVSHVEASVSPVGSGSLAQSCSYSMGVPPLGANNPNSVAASGTLTLQFPCVIYFPQSTNTLTPASQPSDSFVINAVVTTTDTTPTTYAAGGAITVSSSINLPSQSQGQPVAPNTSNGAAVFYVPANSGVLSMFGM